MWKRTVVPMVFPSKELAVTIEYSDDGELHFFGAGPDGTGQCDFTLLNENGKPCCGFTKDMCLKLYDYWNRWHMNHLRPGTRKQMEALEEWKRTHSYTYEKACEYLDSVGLLIDNGHKYGTDWLKEEVPIDVLEWLFTLPGTGATFSDVYTPEIKEEDFEALLSYRAG